MKDFIGINHGTGQIDLGDRKAIEMLPVEIHLKEDGSIDDKPSFAIVLTTSVNYRDEAPIIFGQISLRMLNEGLANIGYEIVKK